MTTDQRQRVTTAVGFLSGVLAFLDALRDARVVWPPDAMWGALGSHQRLELGGGVALIVITIVVSIVRAGAGEY